MTSLLYEKVVALLQSRRFLVMAAAVAFCWWATRGFFEPFLMPAAVIIAAWILGDSMRTTRLVVLLAAAIAIGILGTESGAAGIDDICRAATVRIRNPVGGNTFVVGTGTVFRCNDQYVYILTNAHVAGTQLGRSVGVEFWRAGHQSRSVQGEVVVVSYVRGAFRDVAVVRVSRSQLGGYLPPPIPLAAPDSAADYSRVFTVGCPAGRWPSALEGFAVAKPSNANGDVIHFVPAPAGGRSGSAVFDTSGRWPEIVGLIAWRSSSEGGHNLDGAGESGPYGIAMTHREVWAGFRGDAPPAHHRNYYGLQLQSPAVPVQFEDLVAAQDEKTKTKSTDDGIESTETGSGGGSSVVLRFSDEIPLEGTHPLQMQTYDTYGQGYCPPGGCPPGQQPQQPQQPQGRDQLFPSWRNPEQPQGFGIANPFRWQNMVPWMILGVIVIVVFVRLIDRFFPRAEVGAAKAPRRRGGAE